MGPEEIPLEFVCIITKAGWIVVLYPVSEEQREEVFVSGWPEEHSFEVENAWISGWDFTVVLDDALVGGLDEELDELGENLAASEGVTAVLHEDREVFHLRVDGLDVSEVGEKVQEAFERTGIEGQG